MVGEEVLRPNVIDVLRPETNTRVVIEPELASLQLFHGNLQPLPALQTLDPLVIERPSCTFSMVAIQR